MKTVYQTDAEGFFIKAVQADPSPLELDVWLIPGGCVEDEPPALSEGQSAQWVNGAWQVIDPPPDPEPTQEEIQAAHERAVLAERDRRIDIGTSITVTGIGSFPVSGRPQVQADLTSLVTAAQIAMAAGNASATFPFRDEARVNHTLTAEQVIELYMAGVAWLSATRQAAWGLIDADPRPSDITDDAHWT
ncbi:DUF4376 domain-containing protein [Roseicyclus marinus]|uniref:DUF4376 domain-containing protein n=1 Tax=Roseicyclus marinus TaxID=2161673 RepID=UPI00240EA0D8|nr:hypothetical protein [Roseicyclus marinus]MDG3040429.1 hypothetical protein [Roseicyclus marinus]